MARRRGSRSRAGPGKSVWHDDCTPDPMEPISTKVMWKRVGLVSLILWSAVFLAMSCDDQETTPGSDSNAPAGVAVEGSDTH